MPDTSRLTRSPRLTQAKETERAAREARLAEALRENLHRRKQQLRARAVPRIAEGDAREDAQDDSAAPAGRPAGNASAAG